MVAITSLKAGDVVYNAKRVKMGNTSLSKTIYYPVKIIEVHEYHVIASWNFNQPLKYGVDSISKWKRNKPTN